VNEGGENNKRKRRKNEDTKRRERTAARGVGIKTANKSGGTIPEKDEQQKKTGRDRRFEGGRIRCGTERGVKDPLWRVKFTCAVLFLIFSAPHGDGGPLKERKKRGNERATEEGRKGKSGRECGGFRPKGRGGPNGWGGKGTASNCHSKGRVLGLAWERERV